MDKEIQIDANELNNEIENVKNESIPVEHYYKIVSAENLSSLETTNNSKLVELTKDRAKTYHFNHNNSGIIDLKECIYVNTIGFKPEKIGKFVVQVTNIKDQIITKSSSQLNDNGRIVFSIQDIIRSINIRYEKDSIFKSKKNSVTDLLIYGHTIESFDKILKKYKAVSDDREVYNQRIQNLKNSLDSALEKINNKINEYQDYLEKQEVYESDLTESIKNLKMEHQNTKASLDSLNNEIEILNSKINAKENQIQTLSVDLKNLEDKSRNLQAGNERLDKRKAELEKSVNLFPDTLEGFVKRTNKTKIAYGILSAIPLLILALIVCLSWETLKSFTSADGIQTFEKAWIILIQRLPFTLLVIILTSMCLAFLYKMVRHLTEIQQQELNLAKISILARDVSDSEHINLNEDAIQKLRIDRKMNLIREFMNSEISRYQLFAENEKNIDKNFSFIKSLPFSGVLVNKRNKSISQ